MTTHDDTPLSERDALLMAYVDGELSAHDRRRFEAMMAEDAELAAIEAEHRMLLDIGRASERLEPTDRELRRFWAKFYNRAQWRTGWVLIFAGSAVAIGFGIYELVIADLHWLFKTAILSIVLGGVLLLWSTIRQKVRTGRFDRYRGVLR
jgi:hypothetical protein